MFKLVSSFALLLLAPAMVLAAEDLTASSPYEEVPFNTQFRLTVAGGVKPYRYQVTYGPGSVSENGLITAGEKNGQVKVLIYGADNEKVMVRFRVKKEAVISPAPTPSPSPSPTPPPQPTPITTPEPVSLFKYPSRQDPACQWIDRKDCGSFKYLRKVSVGTSTELKAALADLKVGDLVELQNEIYNGLFVVNLKASLPVYICGKGNAIIDGGNFKSGYGLYINQSSNIIVSGVKVRNAQKGVMMDASQNIVLHNMHISSTGDEAVHFRNNTKNSVISRSTITTAGLFQPDFGEGVYLGSSKNKWCPSGTNCGEPDRSDCNLVSENNISNVKAESIDVKEGTQNNVIAENYFEGSGMTGAYADSFIDVKGNATLVLDNNGKVGQCGSSSCQLNGFQTHIAVTGWGDANIFSANHVSGNLAGPVVSLQKTLSNIVYCNNTADDGSPAVNGVCKNP